MSSDIQVGYFVPQADVGRSFCSLCNLAMRTLTDMTVKSAQAILKVNVDLIDQFESPYCFNRLWQRGLPGV